MNGGTLKTALALWVKSIIPEALVIGSRAANRQGTYPECLITLVSRENPAWDGFPHGGGQRYDRNGVVVAATAGLLEESHYRLTFRAQGQGGQKQSELLREAVKDAVLALALVESDIALTLRDTEVTPAVEFPLQTIDLAGEQDLPHELDQEPFLFPCTLTLRLKRDRQVERAVTDVFTTITDNVHPHEEDSHG